ncbi:GNAT family N-acetyltransferase [Sphingomonas naphthae]|uniref:GNAT family N-acetyltransferase n=1 Tax=Sphingomonas naphthae TaxID=1813468 RepID=A0ABY7TME2_9SPHN|nr:GNAT family N-acetyltransferase [Sphingomonas naphthae]WCT74403.1 GNAT family N-acetyltransferase [Sphingomonas naphthae]
MADESDWIIRPASHADVDRLALIGAATFLETFAGILDGDAIVAHCQRRHSAAAYREALDEGGAAWLVETRAGRAPIGFALVGEPDLPGAAPDGSDIELKRIYILSRFHGGGVGGALMRQAVDHAAAQGRQRLLLGVYAGNVRARAFYLHSGFVQIAERTFRVGDRDYDDVVLARPIG